MLGVTPAEVDKYAAVGMKAMGPKDKELYAQMGMKAMKEYGMGGKVYDNGGVNDDGGPFSVAQAQIEQNLSPLRGNLLSQIESDPKKMAWAQENIPGGLENANVYQLSQAADPNHSDTQTNRITRLARQADLPVATETANLYSRMNSGKFDVAVMDEAMVRRGYEGEAGDIFAQGVVEGKINLGALVGANTKDLGTIDKAGKFNIKGFDVPSGAEFLNENRRSIRRDGSIKGDNNDDLTWFARLGRGNTKTVGPDAEKPEPITPPEVPVTTTPGDPMATINPRGVSPLPNPRTEPTIQGGITPLKDYRNEPPTGPGPSRIDLGIRPEPQVSTYNVTGGGRYQEPDPSVIQPGGGDFIDPEERAKAIALAKMLEQAKAEMADGGRVYKRGGRRRHSFDVEVKGGDHTVGFDMGQGGRTYNSGGKMPKDLIEHFERMKMLGGRTYKFGGKY